MKFYVGLASQNNYTNILSQKSMVGIELTEALFHCFFVVQQLTCVQPEPSEDVAPQALCVASMSLKQRTSATVTKSAISGTTAART